MRASVLVVENDPSALKIITDVIRANGHDVVAAATAGTALGMLQGVRFDLLVTSLARDLKLNGMLLAIEAKRVQPHIAVAIAGNAICSVEQLSFVDGYMPKPFSVDGVGQAIRGVLRLAAA
jgi:DNA-binding response OmpR family regulator